MNAQRLSRIGWMVVFAIVAGAPIASAQDSNYWSSAFGTRSQLLGGVVIGSPGDISAVYYNPGAFAHAGPSELLLAGSAYQYQRVSVENGSGPGRDLASSRIDVVPSLFAGEIPVLHGDRLAYALLTRRSMNLEMERRSTEGFEGFAPIANPIFAAGEMHLSQDFNEGWYGMTWAHPFGPNVGFGVSPFVVVRSQHTQASLFTEGYDAGGAAAVLRASRDFDYLHWGALARLGLSGRRDSLTWGVTLTTPSLAITGSGTLEYNTTLVDQTGAIGNIVGADYEQDVKADYRTPVGAGAGLSYAFAATRVHGAVDWNGAVGRYTVMESQPFTISTPAGDSATKIVITDHLHAVLNWGLGIEHRFGPTWNGYLSYHTDLSGREKGEAPSASITRWDLSHVTAGATLRVWRSDLAFGLSAAFGSQPTPPLPSPPSGPPLPENLQTHETIVTALLGWKISF